MGHGGRVQDAAEEPHDYSGRGMFGRRCVAVTLRTTGDLLKLEYDLGMHGAGEPRRPVVDSMGLGIVAYWRGEGWE